MAHILKLSDVAISMNVVSSTQCVKIQHLGNSFRYSTIIN